MQNQATQQESNFKNYKMSRLDEYRLWAMICDNELNADLQAMTLSMLSGGQSNGGNDVLAMRRVRMAN